MKRGAFAVGYWRKDERGFAIAWLDELHWIFIRRPAIRSQLKFAR